MGSCVSLHRLTNGSKSDKLVIPTSPVKDHKLVNGDYLINNVSVVKCQRSPSPFATTFPDCGSKDEAFFDSHPWLDSDCEDDFFSVKGDFTPSRGNTPVHHFSTGTLRVIKARFEDQTPVSIPEPSPTMMKKKLADLFQESLADNINHGDQNALGNQTIMRGNVEVEPRKSTDVTPYMSRTNSICSSERSPNANIISEKYKPTRYPHCCIPSLASCRSFTERKKKSLAVAVNHKY